MLHLVTTTIMEHCMYNEKSFKKYLKAHLPGCPAFEHSGSGDAHGEILICGEQLLK